MILTAGHPPIEQYDLAVAAETSRLRDALDPAHEHRRQLAAETLQLQPAGQSPARR